MRLNTTSIRWLLTVPAALLGWSMALVVGLIIMAIGDALCPSELMESGWCKASWYTAFLKSNFVFCASISAIFAVFSGSYMAPTHRAMVAKLIYLSGSMFAVFFAIDGKQYIELAGALLSGFVATFFIIKQSRFSNSA